ncbi:MULTISPECIES: hypothetical protein [unclassified Raoultella]|uniref:hypothetical protein n=1 Tax=unclassified Raoultella TaxID=2627600 RepID=UPI0013575ADB|nr:MULTISPECIES: hypothetical protein [unclassified Raoultella]
MIGFPGGSYGAKSDAGDNYKGYFGGLGYNLTEHNAVKVLTYVQDNNIYLDEADKRILLAWQYPL